jgi:ribosomal protein L11 methyltransferase
LHGTVGWTLLFPLKTAGVAQLVEHHLAKVDVASSSLVTRSIPSVYLWSRTAKIGWVQAHEERLQTYGRGKLVIVRRPQRKLLQLEIPCSSQKASRELVTDFGGRLEKLPTNWLKRFNRGDSKPITIGKRLIVVKPACVSVRCPRRTPVQRARSDARRTRHAAGWIDDTQSLVIPASIAFGTGEHATTAMSLRLLEELTRHWKRDWSLVDFGTGSGILALAASRFGARRVRGLDTDPAAISMAKSNARLNKIGGVTFQLVDVRKWKSDQATQVISANLYCDLLIEILPELRRSVWLILSGILRGQETEFAAALRRNKIQIIRVRRRGKWIAILAGCAALRTGRKAEPPTVLRSS